MANIDGEKFKATLAEFLKNPVWANYYGNAPSTAKEYIALEFYASDNDVDDDEDFDKLFEEVTESLEDEDKKYLAKNSPNAQERARFAKMLGGGDGGENGGGSSDGELDGDELKIGSEGGKGEGSGEGGGENQPTPPKDGEEQK